MFNNLFENLQDFKWFGCVYSRLIFLVFSQTYGVHTGAEIVKDFEKPESESVSAKGRSGRWERVTFQIFISYHGNSFDGWQKQPDLNTVQG